ncbi:hypothetical protein CV093_04440 [Oceanobacillus sp. 143]|uniref:Uncharacterized protein n=1 Tax=Oceanobacillus zhaokaii TaxID=2052660 RepID=A0A345PDZ4_9BACI|nr:hypothetical protein [Oceanobacillus zhaokaii]AXI08224.1 hypothetical protein CUC15_04260 [Oceanobacillus zhaokaii]QGS68151.1 hypothetical protein CV093_04440 [Oceanobacillus sp. 143]
MNPLVKEVQNKYQSVRAEANYGIFDIEHILGEFASSGVIWMIQGMQDLTESEGILINHYLNDKRELQTYDQIDL